PESVRATERLLDRIPDGASVEADIAPISRLADRCRVFWIGDTRGITPDYIAMQITGGPTAELVDDAQRRHPGATYTVLGTESGYAILRYASDG
ncbi:hypothetical protein ABZY03_33570, partial [Streptomyces klenkii]